MLSYILVAALCICLHQAEAFSPPPTSKASPPSSTARNLFFGAYLPLGIPVLVAKDKWDSSRRSKLKEQILSLASDTQRGLTATDAQAEEMDELFSRLEKFNPTVNPITNTNANLNGDWSLDYTTSHNSIKSILELSLPLKTEPLQLKLGDAQTSEQYLSFPSIRYRNITLNPTVNPITNTNANLNGDWSLDYTTSDSILGKGSFPKIGPIIQNIDTTTLSAKNSEVVRFGIVDVPRSVSAELSPVNGRVTDVNFKRFMLGPVGFDAPDTARGQLDVTYLDDEVRLTRGDKGNIFVLTRM
eukprot:CAMPEP_0201902652 /NCGR_PEP_ID=MMETSP0902-20130614/55068_1 /ASSEMBLY_ACC=CAM_ASM_000551 /TAXON_ID=420261 /ORGANISM="Thalassiosira antarctica, Strain CCMP982" /LENGTH=299 /DNA_ID=CAMNT_0048436661 /DNA_START=120 /DNA_END=1022 /DNA_ORIENTATION=-